MDTILVFNLRYYYQQEVLTLRQKEVLNLVLLQYISYIQLQMKTLLLALRLPLPLSITITISYEEKKNNESFVI